MTIMGEQMPRIWHSGGIMGTLGQEAIDLAAVAGLELDPWQAWFMEHACSVNEDDQYLNPYTKRMESRWANFEVVSVVGRQNGKGSLLEARELAGLFLFGERSLIHTAHLAKTANAAFDRIAGLVEDTPSLSKHLKPKGGILHNTGQQGIYLKDRRSLTFATRSDRSGRGLTADWIGLDEHMFLPAEQIGALMPTLASRPNPQLWFMGSAGNVEIGDCSQLGHIRTRAMAADKTAEGLFFAEWSINACNDFCPKPDRATGEFLCPDHDDPSKPETWAKANPGMGRRITVRYIEKEHNSMDSDQFLVERCSVGNYPVEGDAWRIIAKDKWDARKNQFSQLDGPFCLAVDTTPDRAYTALAVCGDALDNEGASHVEIPSTEIDEVPMYDHRPGANWAVPRIIEIWNGPNKPYAVIIDAKGPAGSFIDELERAKVNVVTVNGNEYAQACGEFREAVCPLDSQDATLVHLGQPPLASALAQAEKRVLLDGWAWNKRSSAADISPLVAGTLALWGRRHVEPPKKATPWIFQGDSWMEED